MKKSRLIEMGESGNLKAFEERFGGIVKLVESKSKKNKITTNSPPYGRHAIVIGCGAISERGGDIYN